MDEVSLFQVAFWGVLSVAGGLVGLLIIVIVFYELTRL